MTGVGPFENFCEPRVRSSIGSERRNSNPQVEGSNPSALATISEAEEIAYIASDLVAMWKQQKIEGLPRAERNAAIEQIRGLLISAVERWEASRPPTP